MKVGDKVRVTDHSYHVDLLPLSGELTQCRRAGGFHANCDLTVVAMGCSFPVMSSASEGLKERTWTGERNDTLVYNKTREMYFFIMAVLLAVIPQRCSTCGQTIQGS